MLWFVALWGVAGGGGGGLCLRGVILGLGGGQVWRLEGCDVDLSREGKHVVGCVSNVGRGHCEFVDR